MTFAIVWPASDVHAWDVDLSQSAVPGEQFGRYVQRFDWVWEVVATSDSAPERYQVVLADGCNRGLANGWLKRILTAMEKAAKTRTTVDPPPGDGPTAGNHWLPSLVDRNNPSEVERRIGRRFWVEEPHWPALDTLVFHLSVAMPKPVWDTAESIIMQDARVKFAGDYQGAPSDVTTVQITINVPEAQIRNEIFALFGEVMASHGYTYAGEIARPVVYQDPLGTAQALLAQCVDLTTNLFWPDRPERVFTVKIETPDGVELTLENRPNR